MQSGLFGIVGKFPARYITATVGGQALGGVLAAVAEIVSLWLGATPIRSALVYFIMADTFILFSIFAYIFLSRTVTFSLLNTYFMFTKLGDFPYYSFYPFLLNSDVSFITISCKYWLIDPFKFNSHISSKHLFRHILNLWIWIHLDKCSVERMFVLKLSTILDSGVNRLVKLCMHR